LTKHLRAGRKRQNILSYKRNFQSILGNIFSYSIQKIHRLNWQNSIGPVWKQLQKFTPNSINFEAGLVDIRKMIRTEGSWTEK